MRTDEEIHEAFRLREAGMTQMQIAGRLGVSQSAVNRWLKAGEAAVLSSPMRRRRHDTRCPDRCPARSAAPDPAYAYLLGRYLAGGSLAHTGRSVYRLTLPCPDGGEAADEARAAVGEVMPRNLVGTTGDNGSVEVTCYSKHWPCLLPAEIEPWQTTLATERQPDRFIRGVLHGQTPRTPSATSRYRFSSPTPEIRHLFTSACDQLCIDWRQLNRYTISVAHHPSVLRLDEIVGRT
jgi:Homeodomain-like domain